MLCPIKIRVLVAASGLFLPLATTGWAQGLDLVSTAPNNRLAGTDPALQGKDVLRARAVVLNNRLGQQLSSNAQADQSNPLPLRVAFFDDRTFELSFTKSVQYQPGQISYTGQVVGKPLATATMSVVNGTVVLDVRDPAGLTYSLRPTSETGDYVTKEIAENVQAPCGVNQSFRTQAQRFQRFLDRDRQTQDRTPAPPSAADPNDVVDIIIGYTPQARIQAGGTAAMIAVANQSVTFANTAYSNSLVPLSVNPVWIGEVDYTESPSSMSTDLSRISNTNDGYYDELASLREAHRADMVTLLVRDVVGGTCGIAWQMSTPSNAFQSSAYSVTAQTCVTNQTFAHELGHNMGCAHARGDGGTGSYSYSYGHRWTGASLTAYRSVMAYAPGQRIQYFSNPNVNFDSVATGVAIGQPTEAHNAQTLSLNAPTICNWRQRKNGAETAVLQAPSQINLGNINPGTNRVASALWIGNSGDGLINYTISDDAAWLTLPPSGSVNGTSQGSTSHTITFNTAGLGGGIHTANITVTAPGVSGSPKVIPAVINVLDPSAVTNDNFANAYPIAGDALTTTILTTGFTTEAGEPTTVQSYSTGASAWWNWTNTSPSNKNVTLTVSTSNFDTQLSVYTGNAVNSLTLVTEQDSYPGLETVNFTAAPGTTYRIRLAGYNGESGTATIGGTLPATLTLMTTE